VKGFVTLSEGTSRMRSKTFYASIYERCVKLTVKYHEFSLLTLFISVIVLHVTYYWLF